MEKPVELFDVAADPNEQQNLIQEYPDLVKTLTAEVNEFLECSTGRKAKAKEEAEAGEVAGTGNRPRIGIINRNNE